MLGSFGLKYATKIAILNANYIKSRLQQIYPVLYFGSNGFVAHELIFDLRNLKISANIEVDDIAKRLMDYGFHAPTVSFPVPGTIMVEPTESESLRELDRFIESMLKIREEISLVENGTFDKENNPLKNAPHTAKIVTADEWEKTYTRTIAAFPTEFTKSNKFWPSVSRVNNAYGDRNLVCSCLPISDYEEVK
jgi:glycine dehydrogenase